ncbi:TRAP transporter small permease [Peptoniphilus sp. KCTC 25270]|uniref:TRAP transporter small permease n=1 Tax=Peptoniphilus sp. KCTC 25270 TaxID=2897414 RepID=UPI001E4D76A4|nr:TRAP transporter small permease [Peptoniphilus sp. KCTC 25270]MCD1146634.1 TRAP transporter small permease [Peptoniphilus sp. KCTC 25270]
MKILRFLDENLEKYFGLASLVFMVLIITLQVLARFVGWSLPWTEEVTRYVMLWQIWLGASYAVKTDSHLRIEFIRDKFEGKSRIKMELIVTCVWLIFSLWLATKGTLVTRFILGSGQFSPAMQIPMGWAYASVPIGCALMSIRLIQKMKKLFEAYNGAYVEGGNKC